MLLLVKQWSRITGAALALLVLLYYLDSIPTNVVSPTSSSTALSPGAQTHEQDTPYRPQDEVQAAPSITKLEQSDKLVPTSISKPTMRYSLANEDSAISTNSGSFAEILYQAEESTFVTATWESATSASTDWPSGSTTAKLRKTVVMGKLAEEDTAWVEELRNWESAVYVVDLPANATSPTGLKTKMNKSKEAMPYLTFIVENYDNFPDIAVFVHAHRNGWPQAWHNDAPGYDAMKMIQMLQLSAVQSHGYVNLRCNPTPGCPNEVVLNGQAKDATKSTELAYPKVYGSFFNLSVEEVQQQVPVVAVACCAQFAVSQDQVWKRPKSEYVRYLDLIEQFDYDDETLGTVMEYMWHIIFGRDPIHCPSAEECYATVYGKRYG